MNKKIFTFLSPLIAFIVYVTLTSSTGGESDKALPSQGGCNCHAPTESPATVIAITGLPAAGYQNGVVYSITLSISNPAVTGPNPRDGFDMQCSAGSFTAIPGTSLNGSKDIYHNIPKVTVAGVASWTFNWTAPATGSAVVTFNVAGNATNGDGLNGPNDIWNFYATTLVKSTVPVLTVTATSTTIACNGGTSTITATATNGTSPYQYKLNAGTYQSANTFAGNVAGIYTITVKDALNATATTTRNITQPTSVVFGTPTITQPLCNGGTGSIVNTATGGTGSTKTYTITPLGPQSNTTGSFTGLFPQAYTITVSDANSCTKTTVVTVGQPTPVVFGTPTITPPLCNGGTGTVAIAATGGTGTTKTYSINPSGPQTNTTGNFTGLTAQTYTITVLDANNCSKTTAVTMTQPSPLIVTANNVTGCTGSPVTLSGSPAGGTFSVANPYTGPSTTYTYTYTNPNGCTATSAPASITVAPCGATLNLKLFLEGFYSSASTMVPALMNQGVSMSASETDSILVELRDQSTYALVESQQVILNTNGTATCTFSNANGSYYIAVKHRSGLLTWSALPVSILPGTNSYDFSTAANKAYGDNQKEVESGIFALYCGDLNQDENLDLLDVNSVELDISNFQYGYFPTDINGDGNVDLLDTPALEANVSNFVFSNHP